MILTACCLWMSDMINRIYIRTSISGFGGLPLGTNGVGDVPVVRRDGLSCSYVDDG